jgi:predicted RNase H-like HicB family nuclease
MQIVALIHEGNAAFAAAFPDFPGAIAVADSLDAVIAEARRVLVREVDAMIADGGELPRARSLAELADDPAFRQDAAGAMIVLVDCAAPDNLVRVNVALDRALLAGVDRAARALGKTRSEFVADALRQRLAVAQAGGRDESRQSAATSGRSDNGSPTDITGLMESIRRSIAVIDRTPVADSGPERATS